MQEQLTVKNEIFHLEELSIRELQQALENGVITSVELTVMYLNRIFFYDRRGIKLNSIHLLYTDALIQAANMDKLRSEGTVLGPLHGIPFTVKDSYMVHKMTVAAGSPSFINLISPRHSFAVEKIIESGGILIGKTNMPPMACGGMQKGSYGRAESPYNKDFLTAAWSSGSSNGSGTATAANFAVFGMAEETVSSGRSPASNNGLVAYTPSRGLISIRGNWPLFPTKDVVVPHVKFVEDLLSLLDVLIQEDPDVSGDFWRMQQVVVLPKISDIRPPSFHDLKNKDSLKGVRLGIPKIFICKSENEPLYIRPSIFALFEQAVEKIKQCGAEVIEIDFPLQTMYNSSPLKLKTFEEKGYLPENWMETEWKTLVPMFKEIFLNSCESPYYRSWADVNSKYSFPYPSESVKEKTAVPDFIYDSLSDTVKAGLPEFENVKDLEKGLRGLEEIRKQEFEAWLSNLKLDGIIFPANSNIGRADTDMVEASYDEATQQGNYFSNGNEMIRHLGIPTVSVCMGLMDDVEMPVNITFAGPAYEDSKLLSWAYAFEQATLYRKLPKRTPAIESTVTIIKPAVEKKQQLLPIPIITHTLLGNTLTIMSEPNNLPSDVVIKVFINGKTVAVSNESNWELKLDIAPFIDLDAFQKSYLDVIVLYQADKQLSNARHKKIPFNLAD